MASSGSQPSPGSGLTDGRVAYDVGAKSPGLAADPAARTATYLAFDARDLTAGRLADGYAHRPAVDDLAHGPDPAEEVAHGCVMAILEVDGVGERCGRHGREDPERRGGEGAKGCHGLGAGTCL
jgi:hypothetical protein